MLDERTTSGELRGCSKREALSERPCRATMNGHHAPARDGRRRASASRTQELDHDLAGPQRLYGFASHDLTTTWLGTSTGLRRRWVQPTGSIELNAKTPEF